MEINIQTGNGKTIINGKEIESPPKILGSQIQVISNDKIYVNFREYKNNEWKFTFMSIINCLFA